ncbi:hypothetical protein CLPU_9c01280 [Gottschalkia purinilytica]|uniref:Uncharacterized protein n=1 Tax=Gottschalkia purinilytica TaxID=1503 RepID=A0A0L0W9W7_GOTPU|nr:hypothetical protein CLPU_9c01280 [Gottschalkia purinilytica]
MSESKGLWCGGDGIGSELLFFFLLLVVLFCFCGGGFGKW